MSDGQLDLEAMRERHNKRIAGSAFCARCDLRAPCDTVLALDALDAAQRRADRAEDLLAEVLRTTDPLPAALGGQSASETPTYDRPMTATGSASERGDYQRGSVAPMFSDQSASETPED